MADEYIGFRLPAPLALQARAAAESLQMNLSEWLRVVVDQAVNGTVPSIDEGYKQARALAIQLATQLLQTALANMPDSYDEALARTTMGGPRGRIDAHDGS